MVRVPGRHIAGKTDSKEASSLVGEAYIYRCTYHNHHFLIVIKPTAVCKASMCMYACMHAWMDVVVGTDVSMAAAIDVGM